MFTANVFINHSDKDIGVGTGKTITAAITAAGKNTKESGLPLTGDKGYPQVNNTCGVRVLEPSDSVHAVNGQIVVFTAYGYGVREALQKAHATNQDGTGR